VHGHVVIVRFPGTACCGRIQLILLVVLPESREVLLQKSKRQTADCTRARPWFWWLWSGLQKSKRQTADCTGIFQPIL